MTIITETTRLPVAGLAGNFLPGGFGDITGQIDRYKDTAVILCDDTFEDSHKDWISLITPSQTAGTANMLNRSAPLTRIVDQGLSRIVLATDNISGQEAMAIKRLAQMLDPIGESGGRYLLELILAPQDYQYDLTRPMSYAFGLDTEVLDGATSRRRYFNFEFLAYDEGGAAQVNKWRVWTGPNSGDRVDLGVSNYTIATNENKVLPIYAAGQVNTYTGKYEGFRIGSGVRAAALGRLAATPDDDLIDLGAVTSNSLPTFADGLNPTFEIHNRNVSQTAGVFGINRCRLTYLNDGRD